MMDARDENGNRLLLVQVSAFPDNDLTRALRGYENLALTLEGERALEQDSERPYRDEHDNS